MTATDVPMYSELMSGGKTEKNKIKCISTELIRFACVSAIELQHPTGKLSHSSNDAPHPDGALKNAVRTKIIHYRRLYADRPDPIVFIHLVVNTSVVCTMIFCACFSCTLIERLVL
jgi:hypothetical protein